MNGWKTLAFNGGIGLLALLGEVLAWLDLVDWQSMVPPQLLPHAVLVVVIANILLRHQTRGPAGWVRGAGNRSFFR